VSSSTSMTPGVTTKIVASHLMHKNLLSILPADVSNWLVFHTKVWKRQVQYLIPRVEVSVPNARVILAKLKTHSFTGKQGKGLDRLRIQLRDQLEVQLDAWREAHPKAVKNFDDAWGAGGDSHSQHEVEEAPIEEVAAEEAGNPYDGMTAQEIYDALEQQPAPAPTPAPAAASLIWTMAKTKKGPTLSKATKKPVTLESLAKEGLPKPTHPDHSEAMTVLQQMERKHAAEAAAAGAAFKHKFQGMPIVFPHDEVTVDTETAEEIIAKQVSEFHKAFMGTFIPPTPESDAFPKLEPHVGGLDVALGGGFPLGKVNSVFGTTSAAKKAKKLSTGFPSFPGVVVGIDPGENVGEGPVGAAFYQHLMSPVSTPPWDNALKLMNASQLPAVPEIPAEPAPVDPDVVVYDPNAQLTFTPKVKAQAALADLLAKIKAKNKPQ